MRRFLLFLLVIVAIYLMSCITLVRSDERAVVRRFGRILPEKPGPGLLIGLPWGMDRVNRVSVKDRIIKVGWTDREVDEGSLPPGQLLTGDHNLVNVQAEIQYRVIENEVERFVLLEESVEPLIARAADAALAEWLAGHEVDEAILRGKVLLPDWLKQRVADWIAPYELGVRIDGANIVLIHPPSEVSAFFNAVGQQHTRKDTLKHQADQDKKRKELKADEEIRRLRNDRTAYVAEQQLAAQADADSFLLRLEQHRRLTRDTPDYLNLYWLDEMTRAYSQMRRSGRLDVLDNHLGSDGINITQFPLPPKKR